MSDPRPPEHPSDPATDSRAVELQDRDPTSATAPPGSHSGGSNTGNSHHEEGTEANVAETGTKVTRTDVAEAEANENGSGNGEGQGRMSARHYLALLTLACVWVGAQIPLFLFAAVPVYIYKDLGGEDHWAWLASANLLATAAVSPFVGTLSDHFGRLPIAISGSIFIMIGQVICGTAQTMDVFIGGMAISGVGSGISELTTLAGVADIVPISKRGYYTAGVILSVLPFVPSVMYGQLIASRSTWRNIAWITGGVPALNLVLTSIFYRPPPPAATSNAQGYFDLFRSIDIMGGFLSISGLVLFNFALMGGGYDRPWSNGDVLAPLVLGLLLMGGYVAWEMRTPPTSSTTVARWRIKEAPIEMWPTLVITFVSGANFFSVLMLWPGEAYNVYGNDPIEVGQRGLPFAAGTVAGCFISLVLLSRFERHVKWILFGSSVLMTAGCGGLAGARVDNLEAVYVSLFFAGLGVGGIVVPASTVATIVCKKEAFATVTALTIAIRIVGGAIGYAIYFNTFKTKLVPLLTAALGEACVKAGVTDPETIGQVIQLTSASLVDDIMNLPGIDEAKWKTLVAVGQRAYADAYPWVFYISIAFGALSILASLFLGDISKYIDNTVPHVY